MQEKKHVWSYALFHIRLTIQDASADTFEIYPDAIANNQASDLRKRGSKSTLVYRPGVTIEQEIANNYLRIETMDPLIERYRDLYCQDFEERLGVKQRSLPASLAWGVHLNPLFGRQGMVTGSGLMTMTQYERSRTSELCACVWVMWANQCFTLI